MGFSKEKYIRECLHKGEHSPVVVKQSMHFYLADVGDHYCYNYDYRFGECRGIVLVAPDINVAIELAGKKFSGDQLPFLTVKEIKPEDYDTTQIILLANYEPGSE